MFKEERQEQGFEWGMIGDIGEGRPNLGSTMDVAVYRLMQFTLRDVMIQRLGVQAADRIMYEAGEEAGREFCKAMITPTDDLNAFIKEVQELLQELKIGIVRLEETDILNKRFVLTVAEDLDCSGLIACNETICTYDEGFLSGLMTQHTGVKFTAKEVDCWCSGDRVCRFEIKAAN
jgi:predicted hydrocarbon binding protein